MNISGIRPIEGFYTYNVNRMNEQRSLQIQNAQEAEVNQELQSPALSEEQSKPEQKLTAYDYAQGYEPDTSYDLVGAESNIHDLDVEKAISDMQRDRLLQQYQFFVGARNSALEAGNVVFDRPIENFEL